MKIGHIILFATAGILSCAAKTIENPQCRVSGLQHLLVRSVELSDTATRLNMMFVHLPNYWCSQDSLQLESDINGRQYKLKRVENYEFGKHTYMPESGQYEFTIVYEPLLSSDTLINLISKDNFAYGMDVSGNKPSAKYHTHITGTYPKQETVLQLSKAQAGHSLEDAIWIPVNEGKFTADIYADTQEAYEITDEFGFLKGGWCSGHIFPENAEVYVEYPVKDESIERVKVNAPHGTLTRDYADAYNRWSDFIEKHPVTIKYDSLISSKKYYIPEYYEIEERLNAHPEERDSLSVKIQKLYEAGDILTPEGKEALDDIENLIDNESVQRLIEDAVNLNNLAGLFILQKEMWKYNSPSALQENYDKHYAGKFPGHPYSQYFETIGTSVNPIPGNHYNDFTASDLNGVSHTLSEEINGHPALIDLWASWCGGCRKTSKSMIPVYNEFAPKGFKIVGIAREQGNTEKMAKAIEKDGYPWLNLVELDDEQSIWAKYRCSGAGGKVLLVDPQGKIISVNPNAEDVRDYLQLFYAHKQ